MSLTQLAVLNPSSFGVQSAHAATLSPVRQTLTIDAKADPGKPNQFSTQIVSEPEKNVSVESYIKRPKLDPSLDPVSRTFLSVASYDVSSKSFIDTYV